jgi:hypothetical protein
MSDPGANVSAMKTVSFKKSGTLDLFGLVTLTPGVNVMDDDVWNKVKDLKLGHNKTPYVQWAREQGIIDYLDDESPAQVDESDSGASDADADPQSSDTAAPESDNVAPAPKKKGRPAKGS